MGNTSQRGTLSFLKARVAYGQVGREPGAYQTLTTFGNGGQYFAYGGGPTNPTQNGQSGLYASSVLGTLGIGPEITTEIEGGVDFGLFNQRVDGAITYYDAQTRDVILSLPLPPSSGYSNVNKNGAKIENKGFEISVNGRVIERSDVRWEVGVNFTRNRSLVTELLGAEFAPIGGGFNAGAAVVGQPLGEFYQGDFVRCLYNTPDADNIQSGSGVPGDDINKYCRSKGAANGALFIAPGGLPLEDPKNRNTGDPNANYLLGVRNSVTLFKKLSLSALVDIRNGAQTWNGTRGALQYFGRAKSTVPRSSCPTASTCTGNLHTFGVDFFPGATTGPGVGTAVPIGQSWFQAPGIGGGIFNGPAGQVVIDGSFTRLREVSAAYTFDQPFVRRVMGLSSVDVRISGRNLILYTDYDGVDPETNLYGATGIARGIDYFNNPQSKSWAINVTLNR